MAKDVHEANSLTGVFAPGTLPLAETLRTLTVTPRRAVTPGETIRVEFAFSNLGGAAATGVRVRFMTPPGVTHVEGADTLDDAALSDASFIAPGGAPLGELAPNAQRRVACSFRVNERVEDGLDLVFQAALATDQTAVIASNVEHLRVRSAPVLQNAQTALTIAAPQNPKPGDVVTVRAAISNAGSATAHDVRAFIPVPANTHYVPRSARVAGRAIADAAEEPFDYAAEEPVTPALAPGATIELEYQTIVESPLPDGTIIRATAAISSRETAEFGIDAVPVAVHSPPDFSNDETTLTLFCDEFVSPGTRIPLAVRAFNGGTGDAYDLTASVELPEGIAYTTGSAHIDGQPVGDDAFEGREFKLGTLPASRSIDAGISGIVVMTQAQELPVAVTLRWRSSSVAGPVQERRFSRTLRVRVNSRFSRSRNYLHVDRSVTQSRESITFTAHVLNDGTAAEENVRLRIIPGAFFEDVRVSEGASEPLPYSGAFDLGSILPHAERIVTIAARIASPVPDRTQLSMSAILEYSGGTYDLGVANLLVRSRPHVIADSCTWYREQTMELRPGQTHEIAVRFTNDGADALRGAQLELDLPPELIVERTQNASRDGQILYFEEIPAETTHEVRIGLRLVRPPRRERTLTIGATLSGRGISPVRFNPLDIATLAEPQFEANADLRSNPSEHIKAGERIAYELFLRNSGDGPAEYLLVRVIPPNFGVYVPSSTQLNGINISDDLGMSQLWSQRGLALTDVNPDVELRIRWEMLVISPIVAGTAIETRAVIEWDGNQTMALAAPVLRVLSEPSLEAGSAGTPISVAQLVAPLRAPSFDEIVPPRAAEIEEEQAPVDDAQPTQSEELEFVSELEYEAEYEPQAVEAAPGEHERIARQEPPQTPPPEEEPPAPAVPPVESRPEPAAAVLYRDLAPDELAKLLRELEKSDASGLLPHIFAVRTLLPARVAGGDIRATQALENAAIAFRSPLDKLFVRLSAPRLTITAKDLEDRDSRFALRDLVDIALRAPAADAEPAPSETVRLSGAIDREALSRRAPDLEIAPLGSVVPWIVAAQLIGSQIDYGGTRSDVLGLYRGELLKVLAVLETLPMAEFHRVLTSSANRTLDDALGAVLDALRAAARAAVD